MAIRLTGIQKNLSRSSDLAKLLEKVFEATNLSVPEEKRIQTVSQQLEDKTEEIVSQLQKLAEPYRNFEKSAKFQLWERKLLDLTLRNNLLNMKLGKNAISYTCDDISVLEDSLDDGNEVILTAKELKQMYRTVRTNMEETGANTLFLTLGTLHWTEPKPTFVKNEPRSLQAPIMLMPVNIVSLGKDRFSISKRDEDVILNITLLEFLRQKFEIVVPNLNPLPQDTHGVDVNLVMHLFREAIREQPEWSVEDNSILGIFSFTKFVMWNDIHTHSDLMMQNDMIRSLVDGRLYLKDECDSADARNLDTTCRPNEYVLPLDADSSQLEAVIDSGNNRSFVLYGPPGTGKSQSITNIIANSMAQNKRVLFVAEKKAALDVVQNRLAKIGLAPFCLELHSNKMEKKHFLQQMQEVLDFVCDKNTEEYEKTADALFSQRMKLIVYIESLHHKQKNGYSLFDCIERYLSISQEPISLSKDLVEKWSKDDVEVLYEKCIALDSGESVLGMSPTDHPLNGLYPKTEDRSNRPTYVIASQTLESQLVVLPQAIDAIRKQIERNAKMKITQKTARQYLEADYKWKRITQLADIDESLLDDIDLLYESAVRWNNNISLLPDWKKYIESLDDLRQQGLGEAVDLYLNGRSGKEVGDAFLAGFFKTESQCIIERDPQLSQFSGKVFEQTIEKYISLTKEFQKLTQQELIARLSARNPLESKDANVSAELTLLRKRIGNNGRGSSIRSIIEQMPILLPQLCPCMLMSPLSVAQYLDPSLEKFDLVIFDEASQMPTCEAVGAIARGKTWVIVGDPKQMPPTSFFATAVTEEEDADIDDLDSILDDCITLSMPTRYLSWHYRSKHESLIAFSNINYYDSKLVTFPSVDDMQKKVTLQHIDGVYDFGKTRTNIAEARAIVEYTMRRLEESKTTNVFRSVGIIAFSRPQSDLIEDLLNEEFAKRPDLDMYNRDSEEPLFVKNLENVQGDERDIILFSICYGPDKDGKVSMNFGPLNQVGGERRLNVAVSRSRYEMHVFSTLEPEQIDERRTNAAGVLGLKRFLDFAKNAIIGNLSNHREAVNKIAKQISEQLEKHGYTVHTNIGTSTFRVDVAVVDMEHPERYKLGILLDGSEYYKTKTARDREIVQPSILQLLGWNIMHVWTIDWFKHSESVLKNILDCIQNNSVSCE